jgi:RND family efflux transporter MFP subunit
MTNPARSSSHLVVTVAVGLSLLAGCGGGSHEARTARGAPLHVPIAAAAPAMHGDGLTVAAGIVPIRTASPGTVLMGRVEEILKREGDRVRAGEILARIASGDVVARKAQAEAAVAAARAMEENARLTKQRMARLHARQAASTKNLEDADAAYEAALAQLHAAEEGIRAAEVYVDYAAVKAPFDGVVTQRNAERGDMAAPGIPLFVVEDLTRMRVEAQIAESNAMGLGRGESVEVIVDSLDGGMREGTIDEILPSADPKSRTFTVRIVLDNADGSLRPGMFARLHLAGPQDATGGGVAVPGTAIVRRGPLTGVFVVDDGSVARLRWVTLGRTLDGTVEVLTGLGAGERIVMIPPPALEDGRAVSAGGPR